MTKILAIAEARQGALRKISLEVVTAARTLADGWGGGEVHALLIGSPIVADMAEPLARHGADRIHVTADSELERYNPELAGATAARLARDIGARLVIVGASAEGRDLAPRVAAQLDWPIVADVTGVSVEGDTLTARHPMYTGKVIATLKIAGSPAVLSMRPGAQTPAEKSGRGVVAELSPAMTPGSARVRVTELKAKGSARLDLGEAPVIVAGGRGLRAAENFAMLEELAQAFGNAAVGATRAVTDDGWRDPADQIGQTGRLVNPDLYLAVGISGAIQHLAGMQTSRVIVAINRDREAPIFKVADYGIVGDLFEIVPPLVEAVRKARAAG